MKILLVDDHAIIRDGIQMIVEPLKDMKVIGSVADGISAIAATESLRPDVVVMDIAMAGLNGIEATRAICERSPSTKVIILSMHSSREYVIQAMKAGAQGYLLKHSDAIEIIKAVRTVANGHHYLGKGVDLPVGSQSAHGGEGHAANLLSHLSRREMQVLSLVMAGKTSKDIAEALFLSPKTVESYRSRLMKKLKVENSTALVRFALSQGIVPP